jgi:hypothetical protein
MPTTAPPADSANKWIEVVRRQVLVARWANTQTNAAHWIIGVPIAAGVFPQCWGRSGMFYGTVAIYVAGAGDGAMDDPKRARSRKRWIQPRSVLGATAPVLDPTVQHNVRWSRYSLFSHRDHGCGTHVVSGER